MNTIGLIMLSLITAFISYKIGNSRGYSKGRKEGWKAGVFDAASRITGFSYWMTNHPRIHNTLFIVGHYLKNYSYLNNEKIRQDVDTIGDDRIGNLEPEELKIFLP